MKHNVKKGEVIRDHTREDLMLTDPQEARTAQIKAEYLKKDPKPSNPGHMIGPVDKMRMKILALSLFPNVVSRSEDFKD